MKSHVESLVLAAPRERFVNHLGTLRQYASRVLVQGELLTPWEDADREARLDDFFAVGISFDCTYRELAKAILKSGLAHWNREQTSAGDCGRSESI